MPENRRQAHPRRNEETTANRAGAATWAEIAALIAIVAGAALLRLRLLDVPLERDEGEFAYMGQLILRGEIPYLAAHNMKLPGVYYAYAAMLAAFGESDTGIRAGLLLVNAASIVLLYRLGRRLFGGTAALSAAAAFAVLSFGRAVLGFAAKGEHFVVLLVLGGVLLLADRRRQSSARAAGAGLLLGLAFVMKQHAAAFVAFGGLAVLARAWTQAADWRAAARRGAAFAAAAAAPFAFTCLGMYAAGAFEPFWFWTFTYAGEYVSMIPAEVGLRELRKQAADILASAGAIWLLAGAGAIAAAADRDLRARTAFLAGFTVFSLVAVVPGLRFSEHYFLMLLPAASLWFGVAVGRLAEAADARSAALGRGARVAVPLLAIALTLVHERAHLLERSPLEVSRFVYGSNPFPEAVEVARYLRQRASLGDELAVIGSEPEIYFYADLPAATSYIYMYPLMEPHPFSRTMQADMIAQLERRRPRFLVLVNVDTSWSRRPDSSLALMEWAQETAADAYDTVGLAEIFPERPTVYRWGEEAREAEPQSKFFVVALERRGENGDPEPTLPDPDVLLSPP